MTDAAPAAAAVPPKPTINLQVPQTVLKRGVTPDLLRRSRSRRSRSCTPLIQRVDRETTPFELTQNVPHQLVSSLCVLDKALIMDITAEKEDNPVEVLTSDFCVFDHAAVMDISTGEFVIEYEEYEEEMLDDVSVISADDNRSEFDDSEARSESEPPRSGSEAPSEVGDASETGGEGGDGGGEKKVVKKKKAVKKAVVKKKVVKKEASPKAKGKSPAKKGATPPKGKAGGVSGAASKFSQPNDAPKPPKAVKPKKKSKSPSPKRGGTPQKSAAEAAELAKKARDEETKDDQEGEDEEGEEDAEEEEEPEEEEEEPEEEPEEEEEPEPEPTPEPEIVYTEEDLVEQELIRKRVVYSPEYNNSLWNVCTEDPIAPPSQGPKEEAPVATARKGKHIVGRLLSEKEHDAEWQREREARKGPVLLSHLTARTVSEHTPIKLACSVDGPDLLVKWMKNGGVIGKGPNNKQTATDGLIVMELLSPTKDDSGEYTCVIKNKNGEVSTSANVSVYEISSELVIAPTFVSVRGIGPNCYASPLVHPFSCLSSTATFMCPSLTEPRTSMFARWLSRPSVIQFSVDSIDSQVSHIPQTITTFTRMSWSSSATSERLPRLGLHGPRMRSS